MASRQTNIPKPSDRKGRPRTGKTAGVYAALRELRLGESVEGPRAWQYAAYSAAAQQGISIVTRTMGRRDRVTIFRIA